MCFEGIKFSVVSHAAWAPGVETKEAWQAWAHNDAIISGDSEPAVKSMSALLRRRASIPGKMALEVAYRCLAERHNIPIIFASRHGECARSAELLTDLAHDIPLSPTAFSLSVHNASGGLFSIARHDHANNLALAAGANTVEHAVIEACGLLADGESTVLLIAYDSAPPEIFSAFQDCNEQPYAWAWLIEPPSTDVISLTWSAAIEHSTNDTNQESAGLEILRFFIRKDSNLERINNGKCWRWTRHV